LYKFTEKKEALQRILLLDNYDSFTFNLYHILIGFDIELDVIKNDEIKTENLSQYDKIILSPGPGLPKDANLMMDVIAYADSRIPLLGVCLGMQGIAEHLNGSIFNQDFVRHGEMEKISIINGELFKDLPNSMDVGLYHSWAVEKEGGDYITNATSLNGTVMAIENRDRKLYGVQFHPESIMTPKGNKLIENFLNL